MIQLLFALISLLCGVSSFHGLKSFDKINKIRNLIRISHITINANPKILPIIDKKFCNNLFDDLKIKYMSIAIILCFINSTPSFANDNTLEIPSRSVTKTENFPKVSNQLILDKGIPQNFKALNLIPIIELNDIIEHISLTDKLSPIKGQEIQTPIPKSITYLSITLQTLNDRIFEVKSLKTTFNRYADMIYYPDPNNNLNTNRYLTEGGSDNIPSFRQTQRYLLRNDIITKINTFKDDIIFTIKDLETKNTVNVEDMLFLYNDLVDDRDQVMHAFEAYFQAVDAVDLKIAKEIMNTKK